VVASEEQKETRQKEWAIAKQKCVKEQADLVKAARTVVNFVGNVEMPVWNDENKQAAGARIRGSTAPPAPQQRTTCIHQGVIPAIDSVEFIIKDEPPPSALDPNADRMEYPEEAITPVEREPNMPTIGPTAMVYSVMTSTAIKSPFGLQKELDLMRKHSAMSLEWAFWGIESEMKGDAFGPQADMHITDFPRDRGATEQALDLHPPPPGPGLSASPWEGTPPPPPPCIDTSIGAININRIRAVAAVTYLAPKPQTTPTEHTHPAYGARSLEAQIGIR
jgi:hypothetical protein